VIVGRSAQRPSPMELKRFDDVARRAGSEGEKLGVTAMTIWRYSCSAIINIENLCIC
jgi:hypothetical protein